MPPTVTGTASSFVRGPPRSSATKGANSRRGSYPNDDIPGLQLIGELFHYVIVERMHHRAPMLVEALTARRLEPRTPFALPSGVSSRLFSADLTAIEARSRHEFVNCPSWDLSRFPLPILNLCPEHVLKPMRDS